MNAPLITNLHSARGLTLVELLVAIGIMGISMMLIAAAFPAGVAMSVAVSDETTAQAVFQHALGVIRDKYSAARINDWAARPENDQAPMLPGAYYEAIPDLYLGLDSGGAWDADEGRANRVYQAIAGRNSLFSWTGLIRRAGSSGPMGNLFHVVIIVSRRPGTGGQFVPNFPNDAEAMGVRSDIPELRSLWCVGSDAGARILTIDGADSHLLSSNGYIIDSETGQAYLITGVDGNRVTVLSVPPEPGEISSGDPRVFWIIPGPFESGKYGRHSPAVRVFEAMLYLP